MDLFIQALKRFLIAALLICGFYCVWLANFGSTMRPTMVGVLSFGLAYLFAYFWHRYEKAAALASVSVFGVLVVLNKFLPMLVYIAAGYVLDVPFFLRWGLLELILGIPLMMFVFKKLD